MTLPTKAAEIERDDVLFRGTLAFVYAMFQSVFRQEISDETAVSVAAKIIKAFPRKAVAHQLAGEKRDEI